MKSDERPQDYIFTRHLLCSYPKDAYNGFLSRYFVFLRLCDMGKSPMFQRCIYTVIYFLIVQFCELAPVSNQIKNTVSRIYEYLIVLVCNFY